MFTGMKEMLATPGAKKAGSPVNSEDSDLVGVKQLLTGTITIIFSS